MSRQHAQTKQDNTTHFDLSKWACAEFKGIARMRMSLHAIAEP